MAATIEARLAELGLALPEPAKPAANYIPYVRTGNILFVSGQLPFKDGSLIATGKLGKDVSLEKGQEAARYCALNVLAQVRAAAGGFENVSRCVRLGGFVNCTGDFTDQPKVINGASDLIADIMGEAGRHSRTAVGAPALPLDTAVEVDAIFELKG